jgi:prolyl oligopeptidase
MLKPHLLLFTLAVAVAAPLATPVPKTRTDAVTETVHGVTIHDPYRWLEDQQSPDTRAWIDAQNAYTRSVLDPLPGRAAITKRLEELLKTERFNTPVVRNGRYFFTRRLADQNQYAICMRNGLHGTDEVLIDPNKSGGDQTTSVSILDVSEDGKWLVYGTRQGGEDEEAATILDVDAHKEIDRLPRTRFFSLQLTPDKKDIYYSSLSRKDRASIITGLGKTWHRTRRFSASKPVHRSCRREASLDGRYSALYRARPGQKDGSTSRIWRNP